MIASTYIVVIIKLMDAQIGSFATTISREVIALSITIKVWFVIAITIIVLLAIGIRYFFFSNRNNLKLTEMTLKIRGQEFKFSVERNYLNLEIAHKIYIELITRKAALPYDEDFDILEEVYDSWYSLFGTTRDEIKMIKGELLEHPTSESLINMATDVLNKGLRPHLTKYQGRFRRWFAAALDSEENKGLTPQEIQKKYPDYKELVKSMKEVNTLLAEYASQLRAFIYGKKD